MPNDANIVSDSSLGLISKIQLPPSKSQADIMSTRTFELDVLQPTVIKIGCGKYNCLGRTSYPAEVR